jgi:catechol 2,3-dioxygenase-like lactoylglutathione lyase family enzyme
MTPLSILETCLYADDLPAARQFYEHLFDLEVIDYDPERNLFFRCGDGMLLLFDPAHTTVVQTEVDGQPIPLHGTSGAGHVAFRTPHEETDRWREKLTTAGVEIESEVRWPNGAVSLYFRDPAGNCLELATPDLWGL